jgi:predicted nucleotidyltransferase
MVSEGATIESSSRLEQIVRRIVAAIDPDRIIMLGSRARREEGPDSDFDLLIVKSTDQRTLELARRAYRALIGIIAPVDLIVETPEGLERLRDHPGLIDHDALREGRIVYERPRRR